MLFASKRKKFKRPFKKNVNNTGPEALPVSAFSTLYKLYTNK